MQKVWKISVVVLLTGILVYLLYWRLQVSQLRIFDADEFTHLHWAAQVARGERPYVDFFTYFSPGFMWVLAPLFWFIGVSSKIFLAARAVEFGIFVLLLTVVSLLFGLTRSWRWAALPAVILAFLPMPYDKFLEIRPDTIATLFACIGLLAEVLALGKKGTRMHWCISGFFYGLSLVFLVKMAPFVVVGVGMAILAGYQGKTIHHLKAFAVGLLIPLAGLLGWGLVTQTLQVMWRSLIIVPFEIFNNLKNNYMAASLFFYPNGFFYGGNGREVTAGLVVNHALWILALVVGTYRLLTPYVKAGGKREYVHVELLLGLTFFLTVTGYVKFFPSRYTQYLIPIAVFVAYYAADGLLMFFAWLGRVGGYASLVTVIGGFVYLLAVVTPWVNVPKIIVTNAGQLAEFNRLVTAVPLSARVVDLDGRMIFWADGYSVCCLPFDDYLPSLTKPPPSLSAYLSARPADYLYVGDDSGRFTRLLPGNAAYVKSHFTPVPGWESRLWKKL